MLDIRLNDQAKEELIASGIKSFRIDVVNHSCSGPLFGLVPGEPKDGDLVIVVDDMSFAIEDFYAETIIHFDIEYNNGTFRRGFSVYANGSRQSC